jgi:hypothetical protein
MDAETQDEPGRIGAIPKRTDAGRRLPDRLGRPERETWCLAFLRVNRNMIRSCNQTNVLGDIAAKRNTYQATGSCI